MEHPKYTTVSFSVTVDDSNLGELTELLGKIYNLSKLNAIRIDGKRLEDEVAEKIYKV